MRQGGRRAGGGARTEAGRTERGRRRARSLFGEVMEGVRSMREHREGRLTLRTHELPATSLPRVDAATIRRTREALRMSRGVFARKLRVNQRTLERWEQGRSRPNEQAAALILLVRKYPDTIERLERIAAGARA